MSSPRSIAVTLGDPTGIGPEVLCAALQDPRVQERVRAVVLGDSNVWAEACRCMGVPDALPRIALGDPLPEGSVLVEISRLANHEWGRPGAESGRAQKAYLEAAMELVQTGIADALCTGPIHKASIHAAGFPFPGHTEFLQERLGARRVVMMLAGPVLRVALATTHVALADVPRALSVEGIYESLVIVSDSLRRGFGIERPRIAVCGLNPHAGEQGLFGDEEERIVAPAVERARAAGVEAEGPYPADGLFPRAARGGWDAVLAMYHDQGLIPVKTVHRETAVNVTLGLPIVRTSPDHGAAHDIAGRGVADPSSAIHALLMAADLAERWTPEIARR
ncbi:MAG: 4-hydroxythreonine-4-phosphate dehydrogenase PdxA [Pseudomonadota bacterium]|nr:MAG: 4-hydroxythreonine-4-phosphate dehydrogenase PdxA [Pseudomonadota bacterium]